MADGQYIELRKASFKNIPFDVENTEEVISQRIAVHEYAGRNTPYVEELGLGKRSIKFTAYFAGEDYLKQRDRFIQSCEEGGIGTLIHPFFASEKRVIFVSSSWQHSKNTIGKIAVSLEFIESEAPPSPLIRPDTRVRLDQAFQEGFQASIEAFNKVHHITNAIDYVRDSSIAIVEDFLSTIDALRLDSIMKPDNSAALASDIQDVYDDIEALISDETLPVRMGNLIADFKMA